MAAVARAGPDVISPLVSIVIPCYRQGHFLADAVRSALDQADVAVEVIVINDGSDDDTEEVASAFGNRIRYCRQPNQGLPAARNRGLAMATGAYTLFLDADDVLDRRAVGWLLKAAAGRTNVLCIMGYAYFEGREPVRLGGVDSLPPRGGRLESRLLMENFGPPHAHLCSRTLLDANGGFDETLRFRGCEDWDAWVRLVLAGATVVPVREVGAHYRRHPGSMSRNPVEMMRGRAEVLQRTLRRLETSEQGGRGARLRDDVRACLALTHLDVAYWQRERGQYFAALASYGRGLGSREARRGALVGACKLVPHKAWRECRRWMAGGRAARRAAVDP
jgi:GT2 family glycosyltransferase